MPVHLINAILTKVRWLLNLLFAQLFRSVGWAHTLFFFLTIEVQIEFSYGKTKVMYNVRVCDGRTMYATYELDFMCEHNIFYFVDK